jgi:hypothetical protein
MSLSYTPRRFTPAEHPPIGRRVRFSPKRPEIPYLCTLQDGSGSVVIAQDTLCDVAGPVIGSAIPVDVHQRQTDGTVRTVRVIVAVTDLVSVRGRPFVAGVDDRRFAPVTAPTPEPVTAPEPVPPVASTDDALEALRRVLGGGGTDEAAVRRIATEIVEPVATIAGDTARSLEDYADTVRAVDGKLTAVLDALSTAPASARARARVALSGGSTGSPIADALSRWYTVGEDRCTNVLLASPPSLGKSYAVREFGRMYDVYLEHGCSDDVDEIATLLGSPVPDGAGGFVVVDGVLTQAVRAASEGKSVLLLLDEVLRLSRSAQEWLLTFLTGRKRADGTREYVLRTRRVTPDGTLAVLTCDAALLHVVGATNLGMLAPVEAFWSRWETVRFEFDPVTIRAVASAILSAHGVTGADADKLSGAWTEIVTDSRKEVARGALRFPADIRMLERAVNASNGGADDIAATLAGRLQDNLANWSADLGDVDPESAKVCAEFGKRLLAYFGR